MKFKTSILFFLFLSIVSSAPLMSKHFPSQAKSAVKSENSRLQYMPGQIRIKFKEQIGDRILQKSSTTGIASLDNKLAQLGVRSIEKSFKHKPIPKFSKAPDISRIYTLSFSENQDVKELATTLSGDPNIEYAEPIPLYYLEDVPNDPQYSQQNHLPQIFMPQAWGIAKGDSNVIIAIIDGGTDWEHADLIGNIWTNMAEADGLPLVDDDLNGYIDDIHGWDFAENDNNPTNQPATLEAYYHGTVTAGLASAATNNGVQIAGVSWNCTIMPLKHGRDDVELSIFDWQNGAIYAAENGAHIINMSFGSFHDPVQADQDVIDYVYHLGALVVASAGNELVSNPNHYPSGCRNVLSVTWVYQSDLMTIYSPYGLQVDVAAPGVELLSLKPGDGTIRMSGSSSAAPVVSGLAALIKSQHPDWSPSQIMRQIFLTADNIDHLNPQYAGQIGSGRINAYRALTETNPPEAAPRIKLIGDVLISDANGDNIFERGETGVIVTSTYRNYSISPGTNVVFTLTTDDSDLTITNGVYNYGYFPPDTSIAIPFSPTFSVNDDARGKIANMNLGWQTDDGYSGTDTTLKIIIGKLPILIVDDDSDADDDDFTQAEKLYTNILDQQNVTYALWDRNMMGSLSPATITNFPIVIWLTAWCFPSLDLDDQNAIARFLDNGGNLFITGQDIGWDFNDPSGYGYPQRDFYANYLHATYYADDSPINTVIGVPADPIGNGLQFNIWQPGIPEENQYPDEIEPAADATIVFEYLGGANHKFGIKYEGAHKVVYFSMGLEAIDSDQNTASDDLSPIRSEVLGRVLNWLNFIDHTPLTDTENLTDPRFVTARIANNMVINDLIRTELHWRKAGESVFSILPMVNDSASHFKAEIPNAADNTSMEYYIKIVNSYYEWTAPQGAPEKFYSYYVGADTIAPTFSHVPLKSSFIEKNPRVIVVGVNDNIAIDTNSVYIHFTSTSKSDSLKLQTGENAEVFYGELPLIFALDDTVSYYFSCNDKASKTNRGYSDVFSFLIGFEDFESGLNSWILSPDGWGLAMASPHSGIYTINNSPDQSPYPNNQDVSIAMNAGFDLSQANHAALKFWTRVFLQVNSDFGYVEASKDGGITWNQIGDAFNGFFGSWTQHTISLSSYCGPGNTDVRIRFRAVTDNNQAPPIPGWFIDDVQIIEGLDVTRVLEQTDGVVPNQYVLYQNHPNPFNPNTTIRFDLPVSAKTSLNIFNLKGELVRTLIHAQMNAGSHAVPWDGRDDHGVSLASGLYFYQLSAQNFSSTKKLLLIK